MATVTPRDLGEMDESLATLDRIEIYNQSGDVNEYIEYGDLKTQVTDVVTSDITDLQNDITGLQNDKITGSTDQIAKAWVDFNGIGTVAIRESYNVSSITDNGVGDYTLNFTDALENADYSCFFGIYSVATTNVVRQIGVHSSDGSTPTLKSVSQLRILAGTTNTAGVADMGGVSVLIFGS